MHPGPQVERPFQQIGHVGVGLDAPRLLRSGDRRPQRRGLIPGRRVVGGDPGDPLDVILDALDLSLALERPGQTQMQVAALAALALLVTLASVSTWTLFGAMLRQYLDTERRRRLFNYAMASLLAVSIVPVFWE